MATVPDRPPTLNNLLLLPRWARLAFAVRCARRVEPLYAAEKDAKLEYVEAIDHLNTRTAFLARMGRCQDEIGAITFNKDYTRVLSIIAASNPAAGFNVARAALAAYLASIKGADDEKHAADAVSNAANAAGKANAYAAATAAMWTDYQLLFNLVRDENWTDESPVDPDLLGPLWPVGRPAWAAHGQPTTEMPSLTIEIETGDATPEMIANYLEALDNLFHACGGVKLSFKREGCRLFATAEVPS
jgi:hypothetical protein